MMKITIKCQVFPENLSEIIEDMMYDYGSN
ncbi:MAG: hypothetical protein ACFWTN_00665 [Clostridium sp.]